MWGIKMEKRNRLKIRMIILIFGLFFVMTSGNVLGYFTTYTSAQGTQKMNLSYPKSKMSKRTEGEITHVTIQNIGTVPCYVRVKIFVPSQKEFQVKLDNTNWKYNADGYYHYTQMLLASSTTEELLIEMKGKGNVVVVSELAEVLGSGDNTIFADWGQPLNRIQRLSKKEDLIIENTGVRLAVGGNSIGVTLVENGEDISYRNYEGAKTGEVLKRMINEGETVILGNNYLEQMSIKNSGDMDQYVRVKITKDWRKAGEIQIKQDPETIDFDFGDDWIVDEKNGWLYYTKPILMGETSSPFVKSLKIKDEIKNVIDYTETKNEENATVITSTRRYHDSDFKIAIEVNAIQSHNAEEAIQETWGGSVKIDENGTLSLVK